MLTLRSYDVNLAPVHRLCVSFIFMALLWNKTYLNEYWISASGKKSSFLYDVSNILIYEAQEIHYFKPLFQEPA